MKKPDLNYLSKIERNDELRQEKQEKENRAVKSKNAPMNSLNRLSRKRGLSFGTSVSKRKAQCGTFEYSSIRRAE